MRSSMALQENSTGRVDIKVIRAQRDHQDLVVVLELQYGRHETGLNHATSWYRTLWKDSDPHETRLIKRTWVTRYGRKISEARDV